jgi:hypothetical protein
MEDEVSADTFVTKDLCFAGFLSYLFGDESLLKIEFDERRKASFTFHVPSLDAEEYLREYHAGTLAIADLKDFWGRNVQLGRLVREMNRSNQTVWQREEFTVMQDPSPSKSDEWWANARHASENVVRREMRGNVDE